MITQDEQQQVFEMTLQPGWDIVLREVMEKVNGTALDALNTLRPLAIEDERMYRGGIHTGVKDVFEFLKKVEKDANPATAARNQAARHPAAV